MSPAALVGNEEPRLWTPSLVELDDRTSLGPSVVQFAEEILGLRLFPAQKWMLLHLLELRAPYDDRTALRYRTALVIMARQNSKSTLSAIIALYFLYVLNVRLVVGSAQALSVAKEVWSKGVDFARSSQELSAEIASVRLANGETCLTVKSGGRWLISATTAGAGRGLSVDLLLMDELRQHRDWEAYGALSKTTMARPNALVLALTNAGDDQSVVLNTLREKALSAADPSMFIAEWSGEDGCALDDPLAWSAANPGLGYTVSEAAIRSAMLTDPPAVFRTEVLSQRVVSMDGAVDMQAWGSCLDSASTLDDLRDRVALCLDVASDGSHVSLVAAAVADDGCVRVEPVAAWPNPQAARRDLPALIERVKPRTVGWFPAGPAAALGADLRLPMAEELKGASVTEACMAFSEQVQALAVRHGGDPLLTAHVGAAQKLHQGDAWRFVRPREGGHVDAAYAAAGAVHLARSLPPPRPPIFVI